MGAVMHLLPLPLHIECMAQVIQHRTVLSHPLHPLELHLDLPHHHLLLGMGTESLSLLGDHLQMTLNQNIPSIRWMSFLLQRTTDPSKKSTPVNQSE